MWRRKIGPPCPAGSSLSRFIFFVAINVRKLHVSIFLSSSNQAVFELGVCLRIRSDQRHIAGFSAICGIRRYIFATEYDASASSSLYRLPW